MLKWITSLFPRRKGGKPPRRWTKRPSLEVLEDRTVPATWTVSTTADSGANSLRDILTNEPRLANGDTVNFNLAQGATITLTSGSISVNKSLTIDGGQNQNITISGNNGSEIFSFNGLGQAISDTVENLKLVNGKDAFEGGAIFAACPLTLVNDISPTMSPPKGERCTASQPTAETP